MSESHTLSVRSFLGGIAIVALLVGACTTGASVPASAQAPTPIPSASASASASAAASPSASAAGEEYEVKVATDAKLGKFLTGEDGKTLYTFKKDSANKSACSGGCAQAWPPFTVDDPAELKAGEGVSGKLATFARDDGTKQVTYNGIPLYYYATDAKAGDVMGQGIGGLWFVAAP